MLVAWLSDNNTTDWTVGLKFVQFQKNSSYHSGIKRSPFAALFGSDAKVGLTTSALPHDVIHRLQSEDDLLSVSTDETTLVEPSAVEPPAVEPPAVEPPATEPLTADPPAVDLISVEPPAVEPPATEPPTVEQSAVEPTSPLSVRQNNIISQRKRACEAQLSQAERMVKRSRRIMDRKNLVSSSLPAWGATGLTFKKMLEENPDPMVQELALRYHPVGSAEEGIHLTAQRKYAMMENRQFLEYMIATNYTNKYGEETLHVMNECFLPFRLAVLAGVKFKQSLNLIRKRLEAGPTEKEPPHTPQLAQAPPTFQLSLEADWVCVAALRERISSL
ncbi:hypothetical protein Pcinc_011246 [Petrolisthes cinctipes]|uniref:Uncharacterized protein n=2 Tax=Petrolisthes cinctipes TaxID=88211 RepID=A0AAE1G3Y4_PETCI|nr:hypothetical protein Pcinc_011246 [Petrolisthes cinctipes]